MVKPEVAHGASGSADIERIADVHEDDAQVIEFSGDGQGACILRQPRERED
jgi:hypothetical protein